MTEQPEPQQPITFARRVRAIVKLFCVIALLCAGWVFITQLVPRFFLPEQNKKEIISHNDSQELLAQKDAEITALTSRMEQLEAKLKTFEEVITTSQSGSGDTDQRFADLQDKITQLESANQQENTKTSGEIKSTLTSQQADISVMKAEMEKLRSENAARVAALTAFTGLQDAVIQGKSFTHHLTLLNELLATRADTKELLESLAKYADKGVVTKVALQEKFEKSVEAALSPNAKPDSVFGNLKTLVRIRKVGTPEGNDDESIIARAETSLANGNHDETMVTLRELSPPAASAFSAWVLLAQDYINVHKMLGSLGVFVMQPVAAPAPAPTAEIKSEPVAATPVTEPVDELAPDEQADIPQDTPTPDAADADAEEPATQTEDVQ